MKKMSLIIGVAAFVCAALVFSGCESPTDSSAGAPGADGAVTLSGVSDVVSATDLEAVFKVTDRILLLPNVKSVEGKIPAGKTLIVSGATTKVTSSAELEVEGTLEIFENAKMDASGVSGTAGYLIGTGAVTGYGVVALPYLNGELPEGSPSYITYASGNVSAAGKYAASYSTGATVPTAITGENATTILALDGVSTLTLSSIAAVEDITIPANKTLTLIGDDNTITGGFDLSGKGTLVVAEGAELEASGLLTVGDGTTTTGVVQNNGTIKTASGETTLANILSYITKPTGTGTVVINADVTPTDTKLVTLTQNVEIAASKTLTAPSLTAAGAAFDGGKTITVKGTLALPANVNAVGATIVNRGTVSTATTSAATLNTFLALTGNITATAAVTGTATITVPAATKLSIDVSASLTLNDGSVVTGTIEVATGGIIITPANPGSALSGSGKIVLNQDAIGKNGASGFIGPVPGSGTPYEFTWDTGGTGSKVTLTIDSLTLNAGAITAAKDTGVAAGTKIVIATVSTASAGNPHAKLTVASGVTFTVAGTLEVLGDGGFVTTSGTLKIEEGGQVIENVTSKYPLADKDGNIDINGKSSFFDATAVRTLKSSGAAEVNVTVTSKSGVQALPDGPATANWGTAGNGAPAGKFSDLAIDLKEVITDGANKAYAIKNTNLGLRYYDGTTYLNGTGQTDPNKFFVTNTPITSPQPEDAPDVYISTDKTVAFKWKIYVANDAFKTYTTLGVLTWSEDPTRTITLEIAEYDSNQPTPSTPLATVKIDYSGVNFP